MIQPVIEIEVGLNFGSGTRSVGRLAKRDHVIYFEYDASLDRWRVLSREYGVSKTNIELISKLINNRK